MIELPARRGKDDAASLLESADAAASDEPRAPSPYAAVDQGCPFVSTQRMGTLLRTLPRPLRVGRDQHPLPRGPRDPA